MKTQKAFTLVELVITITIAAILLGLAVPAFRTMILNNRLTSHANEFVAAMNLARSEAIKRSADVKIGDPDASDGNDEWEKGWTVWIDTNDDDIVDAGEEQLRVVEAFDGTTTLNRVPVNGEDQDDFTYQSTGTLRLNIQARQDLTLCDDRVGPFGRQIGISPSGRISTEPNITCP